MDGNSNSNNCSTSLACFEAWTLSVFFIVSLFNFVYVLFCLYSIKDHNSNVLKTYEF